MNSDSVASGATAAQSSAPGGVPAVVAGIDVGKRWLDAHIEPGGHARRFPNDKVGRRALRNWLRKHGVGRAVFEPTGRYHRQLHQCLAADGMETVAVRPDCARRFAEALGLLVKTDRVDAKVLARYGRIEGLEASAPLDTALAELQDLVLLRRRFVDELAALAHLDQDLESKAALRQLRLQRTALERRVKALDKDLLAAMPELGVAPCARDSGAREGHRHVRGGRAAPRCVVYMAALCAIRCNPPLAAFYKRLRERGKQPKVALVAVMRKLVNLADALLRANRLWQPSAPPREVPA